MKTMMRKIRLNLRYALMLMLLTATSANAELVTLAAVVGESDGITKVSIQVGDVFLNGQEKLPDGWTEATISLVPGDAVSGLLVGSDGSGIAVGSDGSGVAVYSSGTGDQINFATFDYGDMTVNHTGALSTLASGGDTSGEAYYLTVGSDGSGLTATLTVWVGYTAYTEVATGTLVDNNPE